MCFTVNVNIVREEMERRFGAVLIDPETYRPSYYYHAFEFPRLPVIAQDSPDLIRLFHWGLIPHWTNNAEQASGIRQKTFNARAETITKKPSFRKPFSNQRCLVPVRGFFEWQHRGNNKIPYYIYPEKETIFTLGGVCDSWLNRTTGELINSFSIITVQANPLLAVIHNSKKRMPLIISPADENKWLDSSLGEDDLQRFLKPFPENRMKAHTISPLISKRNTEKNLSRLIEPFNYDHPDLF